MLCHVMLLHDADAFDLTPEFSRVRVHFCVPNRQCRRHLDLVFLTFVQDIRRLHVRPLHMQHTYVLIRV
jgi:hypothetical protein